MRLAGDIERCMADAAQGRQPTPERRFHRHDEYLAYGLSADATRRCMRKFKPSITGLNIPQSLDLAEILLARHIGELGHAGIAVLAAHSSDLSQDHLARLDGLLDHFRSWSHVDSFCGNIMPWLLRCCRAATITRLRLWNRSDNRFKRRASVVTFTRKQAADPANTDLALSLCESLVFDPADIVQKGVGWCLKDLRRADPDRIVRYVKDLRRRGAPATITLYAIRGLPAAERRDVLAVKKR